MGNPFLIADRFSGAVVHLTAGAETIRRPLLRIKRAKKNARDSELTRAFFY
jgi:hypothetical protein